MDQTQKFSWFRAGQEHHRRPFGPTAFYAVGTVEVKRESDSYNDRKSAGEFSLLNEFFQLYTTFTLLRRRIKDPDDL